MGHVILYSSTIRTIILSVFPAHLKAQLGPVNYNIRISSSSITFTQLRRDFFNANAVLGADCDAGSTQPWPGNLAKNMAISENCVGRHFSLSRKFWPLIGEIRKH